MESHFQEVLSALEDLETKVRAMVARSAETESVGDVGSAIKVLEITAQAAHGIRNLIPVYEQI